MTALFRVGALLCVFASCLLGAGGTGARADRRVALVIGNSEYGPQARLGNPRNDAQDIAELLKSLGFETILRVDADKQRFLKALAEFERAMTGADVGLFFYAGHGFQWNGSNYLVPVDAKLEDEISLRFEFVALEEIQRALERSTGVKILILDACRNSPFPAQLARSMKAANRDIGVTRGLAAIEKVGGSVVAYATRANDVASDGDDRNSPFTAALLASLREPGLEIGAVFRKVAARVHETTRGKQVPELSISLLGDVYLNRHETDAQVWGRVRAGNDPAALRDFLARFPGSFYAADARLRLDMLERGDREKELRDRLAALETERLQAEMNMRAAQEAAERQARRDAEAQAAKLTEQGKIQAEQALSHGGAPSSAPAAQPSAAPAGAPPVPGGPGPGQQAALNPGKPADMDEGQLVLAVKTELSRLGCYSAAIDSNWQTPALRKAVTDFAARTHRAKVPDGPAPQLLDDLKARSGRICGPTCGPREQESNGQCVAKTCTGNQVLDRNGNCAASKPAEQKPAEQKPAEQKPVANSAQRPRPEEPPAARPSGRAGCFNFNGRQFCE